MRHRRGPSLSEAQLEIMNIVWQGGEVRVADVWKELLARHGLARNTVQTMMKRLEDKGFLRHRADGKTFYYTAAERRRRTLRQLVSTLVDSAFGGSASELVMALLDQRGVGKHEAERIRKMIDKAVNGRKP